MNGPDPAWSLTDDALVLILHAEHDITAKSGIDRRPAGMRPGQLGGVMAADQWQLETAILRLISTVEAYVNAASEQLLKKKSLAASNPPFTWPQRVHHYNKVHAIDLTARSGWEQVDAGISLRNCISHGLGNLTDLLLRDEGLGKRVAHIDVSVSGNRLQCGPTTVPMLASGCRLFVLDLEQRLVALL